MTFVSPEVRQRQKNFAANQKGVAALKRSAPVPTTLSNPPEDEDAPACRSCKDTGVDRFGFDCVECL